MVYTQIQVQSVSNVRNQRITLPGKDISINLKCMKSSHFIVIFNSLQPTIPKILAVLSGNRLFCAIRSEICAFQFMHFKLKLRAFHSKSRNHCNNFWALALSSSQVFLSKDQKIKLHSLQRCEGITWERGLGGHLLSWRSILQLLTTDTWALWRSETSVRFVLV